ncbi:Inhibin beta chain [Orchesella cincta]|uniref:Inhibin beta chain n=1 Tax=Orchesella cincta TaxID=48709 RepID=A0A1D2MQR8_ORCCI|nr:Inhibin beta chain [Orchesella cincta]
MMPSAIILPKNDVDLELVVKRTISLDALGWQKLDVTSVVQKWYGKQSRHRIRHANNRHHNHRDKLTLLVDCSGCGYCIQPIIFSRENAPVISPSNENPDGEDDNGAQPIDSSDERKSTFLAKPNNNFYEPPNSNHHPKGHNFDYDSSSSNTDYYSDLPNLSQGDTSPGGSKVDNFTEMPFLVLETESAPNFKRSRRRALECSPRVKHCCKQRFYISFKDLDWDDWIIAPRGYYANYCRGSCGGPHRTPDTFLNYHTHVLEEYRRTPEGQANLSGITPCCAPTKFAPMSLIYFGPDLNIIKRDLPKMIVEECGCP